LLFTAPSGDGWIMGGMFASYGDNFLDRLETAVNGPGSTDPITIDVGPIHVDVTGIPAMYTGIYMNFVYDLNYPAWFGIAIGMIAALAVVTLNSTLRKAQDQESLGARDLRGE